MDSTLFAKAHGTTTHFPIALALGSVLFDAIAFVFPNRSIARTLHAASYWSLILGALGSIGAVASGLFMTKGSVLGRDTLRMHHLFVWPAFALLIALAVWRVLVGENATRPTVAKYLVALALMAGLMTAAGYWGGEMMIAR